MIFANKCEVKILRLHNRRSKNAFLHEDLFFINGQMKQVTIKKNRKLASSIQSCHWSPRGKFCWPGRPQSDISALQWIRCTPSGGSQHTCARSNGAWLISTHFPKCSLENSRPGWQGWLLIGGTPTLPAWPIGFWWRCSPSQSCDQDSWLRLW